MNLSPTAKLFLAGASAGLLVSAPYFGYRYYLGHKSLPQHLVMLPASPQDCPSCRIDLDGANATLTLSDRGRLVKVMARVRIEKDPQYAEQNGSYRWLYLDADNGITRISIFGARLVIDGKPTPIEKRVSVNSAGMRNGDDGFGYVLMPQLSELRGVDGEIPQLWVLKDG